MNNVCSELEGITDCQILFYVKLRLTLTLTVLHYIYLFLISLIYQEEEVISMKLNGGYSKGEIRWAFGKKKHISML